MSVDGYLKIKTKLDNKEIDKGISELENKIKKLQEDNSKASIEEKGLQEEVNKYKALQQEADKYKQKISSLNKEKQAMFIKNGFNRELPDSEMPNYNKVTSELENVRAKYSNINSEIDKQAPKIEKVYTKLNKIKVKQTENNAKISEYKQKIEQIKTNKIQQGIDSVGKKIQGQIGKLGKMAIAIVGIQTAWGAVRSAINLVSQYNPQISADFEYMKFCIANLVAPAVQLLIKLFYTVLGYVNAIASAWFGINLFSNSSVKAFQKMQKSMNGTAKSAKETRKSLQSFDEMNVLQDDSDSNNSKIATPSVDLSKMQGEVPTWLKWIIDNKDLILSVLAGIVAGILAIKLGLVGLKALGIGMLIAGVVYTIQSLVNYLNDPSWSNFGKIITGIGVAVLGLGILIGSVPVAVAGAVVVIVGLVVRYWNEIKDFLQKAFDWLNNIADGIKNNIDEKLEWIRSNFGIVGVAIAGIIEYVINLILALVENAKNDFVQFFGGIFEGAKNILDGIIKIFKGDFSGGIKQVGEGIKQIFTAVWTHVLNTFTVAWRAILSACGKGGKIFNGIKDGIVNTFKTIVNALITGINWVIKQPFNKINGLLNNIKSINVMGAKPFDGLWGWSPLPVPQIPKLARGGVITQPTQAIIGETGREAVVPLENNMEWLDVLADKLASKIGNNSGAYIIQLDGRVIQRGQAKRRQEYAFATNGR